MQTEWVYQFPWKKFTQINSWRGEQVVQDKFFFRSSFHYRKHKLKALSKLFFPSYLLTFKCFSARLASCKQSVTCLSDSVLTAGWCISSNLHTVVVSVLFQIPCLRFMIFKTSKDAGFFNLGLLYPFHVSTCLMPNTLKSKYTCKHHRCFRLLKTNVPVKGEFLYFPLLPHMKSPVIAIQHVCDWKNSWLAEELTERCINWWLLWVAQENSKGGN